MPIARIASDSTRRLSAWLLMLFMSVVLGGCTTVKLVGDYDEQIDKGVTQLQKDTETFLIRLEGTARKETDKVEAYEKNVAFYQGAKVAVSSLRVRADAMERNSITVRMLDRIGNNIRRLEGMHRDGLTRVEIEDSIRGALNAQFTAVLTFELAKKRGEKVDDAKALSAPTPKSSSEGSTP